MKGFSIARIIAILLGVLIIALAFSFSAKCQNPSAGSILFKKGTEIWFDVTISEQTHALTVTVVSMNPDLTVDWKTDEAAPRMGRTTISQNITADSRKLTDDFKDGVTTVKENFLWFSKGLFTELAIGKTMYSKDENPKLYGLVNSGIEKMNVSVNGKMKTLNVIHAVTVTTGSNNEYWILNDENNPVILKAVLSNATIQVRQIKL